MAHGLLSPTVYCRTYNPSTILATLNFSRSWGSLMLQTNHLGPSAGIGNRPVPSLVSNRVRKYRLLGTDRNIERQNKRMTTVALAGGFFGFGKKKASQLPEIVQAGDPVLHEPTGEVLVEEIGTEMIQKIIDDMVGVMRAAPGVGIAAPQIGVPLQVAETRFASHTVVLRRLVKVKDALSQMVISNQWSIWKQSNSERAQKVKALILNDDWWDRVNYVLEFTEPIMSMLRFADTDEPCLGDVYDSMDTMLEKIKIEIQKKENDPEDTLYKRVEAIVLHRWNKMTTPLHLLAYALSPRYYTTEVLSIPGRIPPYRDAEVANGYKTAFSRMFSDPEVHASVMREFGMFVTGKSKNHTASVARDQYKMDGLTWWYLHGQDYMYLQPLAIKILSQIIALEDTKEYISYAPKEEVEAQQRNPFDLLIIINPKLKPMGNKTANFFEGCLSVKGFRALVKRHLEVEVTGLGRDGLPIKVNAIGWQARILQHECDHLGGLLYVDRMTPRTFRTVENLRLPLATGCPKPGVG